jgi:hypothetical protein
MIKLTLNTTMSRVMRALNVSGFTRRHFIQQRDGRLAAYVHRSAGGKVQTLYINADGQIGGRYGTAGQSVARKIAR